MADFGDQTFGLGEGPAYREYTVRDLLAFANVHCPIRKFKVADLAFNLDPETGEAADEPTDSPEFAARAMKSNFTFPLLLVQTKDGETFIADGLHRLWKARHFGLKNIKARLLQEADLKKVPVAKK